MRCRLVIFVIWIKNSCLPYSFHYFVELELDALWFNGAPPINLPGEDDAFLVDSIPSVSFGEPASPPPVLFDLVIFPPVLFWAYTLDTIAGAATRLIDNNAILRATPATILARFLFICLKVNCILYNYCKLLANINQLNIVLSDSAKYKSFIQSMYSISERGSISSRFFWVGCQFRKCRGLYKV